MYKLNRQIFCARFTQWFVIFEASVAICSGAQQVTLNADRNVAMISDGRGELTLRIDCRGGCAVDQIKVRDRNVASNVDTFTGIRVGDEWFTSKNSHQPEIKISSNTVTLRNIHFGRSGQEISETWQFQSLEDRIVWKIRRHYPTDMLLDKIALPLWNFDSVTTWTGGLLDNGGVIWDKYLDKPKATYGGHFRAVTFWNAQSNDCLRIVPRLETNGFGAGSFTRTTNDAFSFEYSISGEKFKTKNGQSRFLSDRQDLWQPVQARSSDVAVEIELQALAYDKAYNRGEFVGLDGDKIRELFNTVARYGVIDSQLVGGNGWRSGYICLHEPFFAQIASALNAPDYTANLAAFLDNARDHAIAANGRVKSRWCYGKWDAMPGSYDEFGFYEAQWGYLMDSQPDYVMNVVELFNVTADKKWLTGHKQSCECALDFLLRREVGTTGLVAMMTDSHSQNRGSDWIDIIWAAYENAFVNAQLYAALNLWADAEDVLNDPARARSYRDFAARLKMSFNKSTANGGFWDATNQWYVYWRDKDGSIHGDNLVTPVNFAAIAYGLCDDPLRQRAVLDRIESEMKKENLFHWPLSFFPYADGEGAASNFPFPKYENGDIFLSWGELGVRAYAAYDSALALKYVKKTLDRYSMDGLSFQRYLRQDQRGEGDDILAGNCMPVVGLYRNIYGVQPKPNRLYLEPHLPVDLDSTRLRYNLRGQLYEITLHTNAGSISAEQFTVSSPRPFAANITSSGLQYFDGMQADWTLSVGLTKNTKMLVNIFKWSETAREWVESPIGKRGKASYVLKGLRPKADCRLSVNGKEVQELRSDLSGQINFERMIDGDKPSRVGVHLRDALGNNQ